jgi:hypothetical protein
MRHDLLTTEHERSMIEIARESGGSNDGTIRQLAYGILQFKTEMDKLRSELVDAHLLMAALCENDGDLGRATKLRAMATTVAYRVGP